MKTVIFVAAAIAASASGVSAGVAMSPTWGYRAKDKTMVHTSTWKTNWPACGGTHQSPIDIDTTPRSRRSRTLPLEFHGRCPTYNLTDPHEPLEVDVAGGDCGVTLQGEEYNMKQFHLHTPSEHTFNGVHLDGEIHFVHATSDSEALLVVGIFLKVGPVTDEWLKPVLDALELVNSTTTKTDALVVDLNSYFELVRKAAVIGGVYNYAGSLTTPGCEENADWWVVENPIRISAIDFGRLHQDLVEYHITDDGDNARSVQPLNDRVVTRYRYRSSKKRNTSVNFSPL